MFFNDITDDNIELTEPIDIYNSGDESLGDHINYDPAMNAYSATSDSDVESPYEPERLSRYVSRMQREIELDTSDRSPYPLEIQPLKSIAYATTLVDDPKSSKVQPSTSTTEHSSLIIELRPKTQAEIYCEGII